MLKICTAYILFPFTLKYLLRNRRNTWFEQECVACGPALFPVKVKLQFTTHIFFYKRT